MKISSKPKAPRQVVFGTRWFAVLRVKALCLGHRVKNHDSQNGSVMTFFSVGSHQSPVAGVNQLNNNGSNLDAMMDVAPPSPKTMRLNCSPFLFAATFFGIRNCRKKEPKRPLPSFLSIPPKCACEVKRSSVSKQTPKVSSL